MASPPKKPWPFRIEYPPELPISARVDEIVGAIQRHPVVIIAGETGSGKTTQLPKLCLAAGCGRHGRIACTQPRRVAATSISRRVAEELGVTWGREVGCKIRFADQTSGDTLVKFMTDGMLLAELQADPLLRVYDTIIVDEAHERSLNIDFILGHLRRLRARRPDLKIVITSATIDTEAFAAAFDGAPVIEVSGRVYPVEVIWSPLEEMKPEDADAFTYIDGAVETVQRILQESAAGDILVFLPTERDIRETCDLLEGAQSKFKNQNSKIDLVPLFGRLTNAEQQRVFAPTQRRKVVVATNIAETSLTIPGIRFVVDSGLARVSRYAPQSRTRRLPIEPVARSSADQRKGRCGRVSDGVCIRLFAEQDYNDRPRFAQPEIQRSNLADVILRMKAFGLGDIEEFPFLNAPPARGIRAGYALLEELGALEKFRAGSPNPASIEDSRNTGLETRATAERREAERRDLGIPPYTLTELGRELAGLPVDPTIGRMILQAREEGCLREVLVIAAALSIQDPRERPLDQQAKADAAHRRFTHPDSDFLTLLSIWEAYHEEFDAMTLGKLRKFCTSHFLSFMRMREWRDVLAQLQDLVRERAGFAPSSMYDGLKPGAELKVSFGTPAYAAVHRSILAGLLGNVATLGPDGTYHATHDRKVGIFPGSALFEKGAGGKRPSFAAGGGTAEGGQPGKRVARWLMAAEIMETGRVYARTCARIDPQWILKLGAHLLRVAHSEPFWNPDAGRVLVKERRRLYNLEIETRSVGYARVNPRDATEIFIREGLVGDTVTWPFDFLAHNRRLRERIEAVLTRARSAGYMNVDEAMYRYYARRLLPAEGEGEFVPVGSTAELVDLVRHRQTTEPKFLCMAETDLRLPEDVAHDAEAFPESVPLENRALPLSYAYKPGRDEDGVTLRVGLEEFDRLTAARLDWLVPGHRREKVELMLKALPKEQRRLLIPLAETAQKIADGLGLVAGREPPPALAPALAEVLSDRLGVRIDPRLWADKALPDHLRVRVEVVDADGAVLGAGRELADLRKELGTRAAEASRRAARGDDADWRTARARWEQPPAREWKFGDLPASVVVAERAGVAVRAHPGLQVLPAGVAVRLFATADEAAAATRAGLRWLLEEQLRRDLGWLEKDLRDLRRLGAVSATLGPTEDLQRHAAEGIRRWVCDPARVAAPQAFTADAFARAVAGARADLRGLVPKLCDQLEEILGLRQELLTHPTPYPGMEEEIAQLLPGDFLAKTPFERLRHLPRYLRARRLRAERWKRDPAKDAARAEELRPFAAAAARVDASDPDGPGAQFRWLVEEFRVSLFAQELGTAEPVSAVRLERARQGLAPGEPPPAVPKPKPVALPTKGRTVLKSFDALGNLPR